MSASDGGGRGGHKGGFIASLSVPIGFVAEYAQHRKQLKKSRSATNLDIKESPVQLSDAPRSLASTSPFTSSGKDVKVSVNQGTFASGNSPVAWAEYDDLTPVEDDENLWELDDYIDSTEGDGFATDEGLAELSATESVEGLVRGVMNINHGVNGSPNSATGRLPFPVIIPQRRPRNRSRGFLRAYAPALGDCGIDSDTFLQFLKNFHTASRNSPIFDVVMMAAQVGCNIPNHIINPIAITASAFATVGSNVQSRSRTNKFLDRMNQELFQPAGLYAMIIKYKTDMEMEQPMSKEQNLYNVVSMGKVDLTTTQSIAKFNQPSSDGPKTLSARLQKLRVADGVTRGTIELPEACPLVFPDLDNEVQEAPDGFKAKFKDASKFVNGYLDRSAQRKYATDNPDTLLTVPESQRALKSTYSDPSHPMYSSGTFLAFVSGGAIRPSPTQLAVKREKALHEDMLLVLDGREPKSRYIARYGDGYYEELYSRTVQYRDLAFEQDIELVSKGSEPKSKQDERYGEDYYEELYNRTREYREQALQEDLRSVSIGREPTLNREAIYGKGYSDELWAMTTRFREQALVKDLGLISTGQQPNPGQDLIYGAQYYDELSAKCTQHGFEYRKDKDLERTSSKSLSKKTSLTKKISEGGVNPLKSVRRVVQEDVLYLMIVNMPSQAELNEARVELAKAELAKREKR